MLRLCLRLAVIFTFLLFISLAIGTRQESYLHSFQSNNTSPDDLKRSAAYLGIDSESTGLKRAFFSVLKTLNLSHGYSKVHKQETIPLLKKALKTTLSLTLPSLLLGFTLAFFLGALVLLSHGFLGRVLGSLITILSSLHLLTLLLSIQVLLCTSYGLSLFPTHGWETTNLFSFLKYSFVPILIMSLHLASLFAPLVIELLKEEELQSSTQTLRALGCPRWRIVFIYHLKKILVPLLSHISRQAPAYLIGGSFLIENTFGLPGMSFVGFESCLAGEESVLLSLMALFSFSYLAFQDFMDLLIKRISPNHEKRLGL